MAMAAVFKPRLGTRLTATADSQEMRAVWGLDPPAAVIAVMCSASQSTVYSPPDLI